MDLEPSEKIRASQQLKGTVFITNQGFAEKCGSKPGFYKLSFGQIHRRRIKTEEWAKVVAAAWGTELNSELAIKNAARMKLIQFFGRTSILGVWWYGVM